VVLTCGGYGAHASSRGAAGSMVWDRRGRSFHLRSSEVAMVKKYGSRDGCPHSSGSGAAQVNDVGAR
jgi:hypothetical protein